MARFRSMTEYLASLKDGPTPNWPLKRMTRQARRAVEKSMKGMPSDAIEERVREAVRDVLFLWYLYLQVNRRIHDDLRTALPMMIHLAADVRSRLLDESRRADAARAWLRASRDFPYPLDPETAGSVEAALAHRVESWIVLRDAETIDEWVYEELGGEDDDEVSEDSAARIARRVERAQAPRPVKRTGQAGQGRLSPRLAASVPQYSPAARRPLDRHHRPRTSRAGRYPRRRRMRAPRVRGPAYPRLGGVRPDRRSGRTLSDRRRLLA